MILTYFSYLDTIIEMSGSVRAHPQRRGPSYPPCHAGSVPRTDIAANTRPDAIAHLDLTSRPGVHVDELGETNVVEGTVYPEGGYGWVVTAAAFMLLFQYLGVLYAWGVIQAELSRVGLANSLQLSLIGATAAFCLAFGCLPAAWILSKAGPRWTALCGTTGSGLCLIISGFSLRNLGGLIFLHGFAFGAFGSLVYLTAYTIPSQWFLKKRGLSTGIASCGAGIGGAIWSIAIERLIAKWGLAWVYRFLGLSIIVVGGASAMTLKPGVSLGRPSEGSMAHSTSLEKGLIKSSRFIRILFACFIASYPFLIPPYYISQYSQSIGLSASQGALYTALYNVASGFGRIGFGSLADEAVGNMNSWLCSLIVIAVSSLTIWVNATSEALIILFVLLCGAGSGGFFSLQTSVVAQVVGSHRLHQGIAWLEVAESFGYFAGPISAGALLDAFGGTQQGAGPYRPAIFLVGGTTALSLLFVTSVRYSTSKVMWKRV